MTIFYRVCEECSAGMNEGYIYADGTFCSIKCLPLTESEWNEQYTDDGDNYFTTWEDEPSEEAEELNERNKA